MWQAIYGLDLISYSSKELSELYFVFSEGENYHFIQEDWESQSKNFL